MTILTLKHCGGALLVLFLLVDLSYCIPTSEELAQRDTIVRELRELQYLSVMERKAKINGYLDTFSGRNFIEMLGGAVALDLFKGWSLEARLNYYRSALDKQDADYSIEPGTIDNTVRFSIVRLLGDLRHSLQEAGIEPPPIKPVELEQPECRQRLVGLIDNALTQISQKEQGQAPGNKSQALTNTVPQRISLSGNQATSATPPPPSGAITPTQYLIWTLTILAGLGAITFLIKRKSED